MSTNLLDLAKAALGSGAFGKIAGSLGESEEKTKSAFDLAGSAILGGLMKKISNPQGAKDVYEEVNRFDTSTFDNITQVLTGGGSQENQSALGSLGGKLISSLLGSNQDSVIGMIAKHAGIGQGSSKSLLTMIAPLLLGTIAKQVKSGGLNLSGLTKLITDQKSVVSKNLPSEFTRTLGIANLLDDGSKAVQAGSQQAARTAKATAGSGVSLAKVLIPLAVLAGLGFLLWRMASPAVTQVADKSVEAANTAVEASGNAINDASERVGDAADRVTMNKPAVPGVNFDAISNELGSSFGTLTESISNINDEASAQQALPQIEELTRQIGQYGFDKMPEAANSTLQNMMQPWIEKLRAALETAYNIPGVKPILEPAVTTLMNSVSAYTRS